jgi:hypothetical protein
MNTPLRQQLIDTALLWEGRFGNIPSITTVLSEYDAAMLVGMTEGEYSAAMVGVTSVQKGYDFKYQGARYQVKGNRPSGKPGSSVTWVPKATNYKWDSLVWILYDHRYVVQEAWLWAVEAYREAFHEAKRLSPAHYRNGKALHLQNATLLHH